MVVNPPTWGLHGLAICSDIELPGATRMGDEVSSWRLVSDGATADTSAPGELLMLDQHDERVVSELRRATDRLVFRAPGVCTVEIEADLRRLRVRTEGEALARFVPLVVQGALSAALVELEGDLALHASAVDTEGGAILFAGASGQGKSTTAAMALAGGAAFFSDDVVRVGSDAAGALLAHRGTMEVRLRPAAWSLADDFDRPTRQTADERLAVSLEGGRSSIRPIRAVVLPRPDRSSRQPDLERLPAADAFVALHQCFRLASWVHPPVVQRRFALMAALVDQVPVVRAAIPWQLPFSPDAGRGLLSAIDCLLDGDRRTTNSCKAP